ncbi:MAG TPA: metallophosphoesterase family protein [Geminicoccaceae bacterium]|nr:metallophosphoesterase family protein [Geminicoccaceae bacterium]
MTVFFTSDQHFGHGGALGLFRRPFPSVAAMDEAMVQRWNAVASGADTVWHLGDFAVRRPAAWMAEVLGRLNGTKHLIAGNNDGPETRALAGWASVGEQAELELDGIGLVLCHYALKRWPGMERGVWSLHGHSHGQLRSPRPRQVDVGVDVWDFRPVTLAQIIRPPT